VPGGIAGLAVIVTSIVALGLAFVMVATLALGENVGSGERFELEIVKVTVTLSLRPLFPENLTGMVVDEPTETVVTVEGSTMEKLGNITETWKLIA